MDSQAQSSRARRFIRCATGAKACSLPQGVHPKVVREMLGHSTIAITMDLYSHTTPALQCEAATKLDAVLQSAIARVQQAVA